MEKYLTRQTKRRQQEKPSPLRLLRLHLENRKAITTEILTEAMKEDKIASTRELLLFHQY